MQLLYTPLAMSEKEKLKLEQQFSYSLDSDFEVDKDLKMFGDYKPKTIENLEYNPDTGIGVIQVSGLLVDKYDPFMKYFYGATSYEEILDDTQTMLDAGAHTIVQYNDSGGGQAYNLFASAKELRNRLDSAGAQMITYSDGITASAAFGLAAVSDKIVANPDSEIGSVGVVISLLDTSEYMKNLGISRKFITAGKNKVPFDDDGKFTQDFLDELESGVQATYQTFKSHISSYRPVSDAQLEEVGAKVFSAKEAKDFGYIDEQMTREEFAEYLADIVEQKGTNVSILSKYIKKTQSTKETPSMSNDNQIAEAQMAEVRASVEAQYAPKLTELEANLTKAKAEFETQLSQKDAEVEALKASLQAIEDEKKEAKSAARLSQLTEIFGDVKGKELSTKFEALTDTAFSETVALLSGVQTKADQKLEKEDGSEGEPVDAKPKTREEAMAEYLAKKQTNAVQKPF